MKTFTAWLLANFEIFITGLSLCIMGVIISVTPGFDSGTKVSAGILMFFLMLLPTCISTRNLAGSAVMFVLSLLWNGLLADVCFSVPEYPNVRNAAAVLLLFGVISLVISVFAGLFTAGNMREVVSRRMMYHNSNAQMFNIRLSYTLNRSFAVFAYINWAAVWPVLYISVARHGNEVNMYLEKL